MFWTPDPSGAPRLKALASGPTGDHRQLTVRTSFYRSMWAWKWQERTTTKCLTWTRRGTISPRTGVPHCYKYANISITIILFKFRDTVYTVFKNKNNEKRERMYNTLSHTKIEGKDKICGWKSCIKSNVYWGIIGMEVWDKKAVMVVIKT